MFSSQYRRSASVAGERELLDELLCSAMATCRSSRTPNATEQKFFGGFIFLVAYSDYGRSDAWRKVFASAGIWFGLWLDKIGPHADLLRNESETNSLKLPCWLGARSSKQQDGGAFPNKIQPIPVNHYAVSKLKEVRHELETEPVSNHSIQ